MCQGSLKVLEYSEVKDKWIITVWKVKCNADERIIEESMSRQMKVDRLIITSEVSNTNWDDYKNKHYSRKKRSKWMRIDEHQMNDRKGIKVIFKNYTYQVSE